MITPKSLRPSKRKLYTTGVILIGIVAILTTLSIFFSPKLGEVATVSQNQSQPVVAPKPKPKPKPVVKVAPPTTISSDYTLPPITDGMAPVVTNIQTDKKVVFLTIDDGAYKDQSVIDILATNHIKAALFLSRAFIADDPQFFDKIILQGSVVEDHTLNHDTNMYEDQTYAQQKAEICGMSDYDLAHYGKRPTLFRPPGGAYSDTMRKAAADCGMKAVVTWIAKANGGAMQYQIGDHLRPGDIVLMHFRPVFKDDMKAFIKAKDAAGLQTELLEDWLVPNS